MSFFSGVRALFGGVWFVVRTPSAWGWAAVPVAIAGALFTGLVVLTAHASSALAASLVDTDATTWHVVGGWALRIALWLLGVLVAFVLAISLAQPFSGFALDAIARKQELALGGRRWPEASFATSLVRSVRVTLTALAMGLPLLALLGAVTFLFPPAAVVTVPLKLLAAGWLAAYDLLDYPLSIRGQGVRGRLAFMRENAGAVLGFGVAAAVVLLVPGMGLFLLPWGVAGATRLVVASDATRR